MHPPGPLGILRGHSGEMSALHHLSPPLLLSGDSNGVVMRWNLTEREALSTHDPHVKGHPVISLMSPAGRSPLVQYRNGDIVELDEQDKVLGAVFATGFCPSKEVIGGSAYLVGAGGDGDTITWVDKDGKSVGASGGEQGMVMWVESVANGVVAGYEDGKVRYWDERRAGEDAVWVCKTGEVSLCGIARGLFVVCGGVGGVWVVKDGKVLDSKEGGKVGSIDWREDGKVIATGRWDGDVDLLSGKRKQGRMLRPLGRLKWHDRSGLGAVSWGSMEGGGLLVTGAKDKTIAIWKLF